VDYGLAAVRGALDSLGPAIVANDRYGASSDTIWIGPFQQYLESEEAGLSSENLTKDVLLGHIAAFLS